ncbi:MAG: hypothetical protein ACI3ZO_06135 [Candidatus Cryptobacteroides sp.]
MRLCVFTSAALCRRWIIRTCLQRLYYINVILQLKHRSQAEYRHFRIAMNRNGVIKVEEIPG